jgi:hypothetical protein
MFLSDLVPAVPKIPEKSLISHDCASWPAAMYGFFNSIMWAQVINKVMDVKPTLERNTQLEVTLYK